MSGGDDDGIFQLTTSTRTHAGTEVHVVTIGGDLDAYTFPRFLESIEALRAEGVRNVVVDCESLSYVSSAGLGVLKKVAMEVRAIGGDIRLAALSEKIANILNLLGFSRIIRCFDTVDEAVRSFAEA